MSSAKITLITFARYMQQFEKDLFRELSVPAGIEKDVLVDNIFLRGGEFEVVYSDPDFMQYAIGSWSRKWYRTMEKWISALSIDYNPLENYDRYETFQDNANRSNNTNRTLNHQDQVVINTKDLRTLDTENKQIKNLMDDKSIEAETVSTKNLMDEETRNLKDKETPNTTDTTTYNHSTTTEEQVSAYDSSSYQPSKLTTLSNGVESGGETSKNTDSISRTGTDTFEHTGEDTFRHSGTEIDKNIGSDITKYTGTDTLQNTGTDTTNRTGTETTGHTGTINDIGGEESISMHAGHLHGNIGVTTSQQMLQEELDISKWNIYENITDLFLTEFVIPIYS